jgi:hypothetical protein
MESKIGLVYTENQSNNHNAVFYAIYQPDNGSMQQSTPPNVAVAQELFEDEGPILLSRCDDVVSIS